MRRPVWATPQQVLLLRAALARDDGEAAAAWRHWRLRDDLDSADAPSQRLLPLLYRRLAVALPGEPLLPRLKGVYRYHWYRNQQLVRRGTAVVAALRAAGIETIVLKGAAVAALHYGDFGVRPLEDVDLLVRPAQARAAAALLARDGWRAELDFPRTLDVRHDHNLVDPAGRRVDLHWTALWEPGDDEGLWACARPAELAGESVLALDPSDAFLVACAHGAQWNPGPIVQWAADAAAILRGPPLDWERIVVRAQERWLGHALGSQLRFLARELGEPVPEEAIVRLETARPHPLEVVALRARLRPHGTVRGLTTSWIRYRRLAAVSPDPARPRFPLWLGESLGLDGRRRLAVHAARRLVRLPAR